MRWWYPTRWVFVGIAVLYCVLALSYNVAFPPFEPPDEIDHFEFVRDLIGTGQLPIVEPGVQSQAHQPPLYYLVSAVLAAPFSSTDFTDYANRLNPARGYYAWEPGWDNKNFYIHGPWDAFPGTNTALAVRVSRLASILFGLVTLILTYQLAMAWRPDSTFALLVTGLVALQPMFLHISGALQNDAGVAMAGTLFIWLGLVLLPTGLSAKRAAFLGVVAGLAVMMKLTALPLVPIFALWFLFWARRQPLTWARTFSYELIFAAGFFAVSGWWFWRNWNLYGDLFAMKPQLQNFGQRASLFDGFLALGDSLHNAWMSFWASFGHGIIILPDWVYSILGVLTLMSGCGLLWQFRRLTTESRLRVGYLASMGFGAIAGLFYYIMVSPSGANARYTFSALAALMLLLAEGLFAWFPTRWHKPVSIGLLAGLFSLNIFALTVYVLPAYAAPTPLTALPAAAVPVNIRFGDIALLRGYSFLPSQAHPGERVYISLYWEPLKRTDTPYRVFIHLVPSSEQNQIVQRDTYPGLGRNPTNAWQPNQLFVDTYMLQIPVDVDTPMSARWRVGLWEPASHQYAYVLNDKGEATTTSFEFGALTLTAAQSLVQSDSAHSMAANLGNLAQITGYTVSAERVRAGEAVTLTVYWQPQQPTDLPYTVWVHLRDTNNTTVAQNDAYPRSGKYLTTLWVPNAAFKDAYVLTLPTTFTTTTELTWEVGLWQADTGGHAFLLNEQGEPIAAGATLGTLTVTP